MGFTKENRKVDISNLKKLIESSRMSHRQIAEDSGIAISTLRMLLSERYEPSCEVMMRLADYFNVPIDYLIGRVSDEQKDLIEKDYYLYFKERRKYWFELHKSEYEKKPEGQLTIPPGYVAPWPYNLVNDIFQEEISWVISKDQEAGLMHSIDLFANGRNKEMLLAYYRDYRTLEDIARDYNLTRNRVHQIIARCVRIMRSSLRKRLIEDGLEGTNKIIEEEHYVSARRRQLEMRKIEIAAMEKEIEDKKDLPSYSKDIYDTPILETFDFSVRTFNCLARGNINTLRKIVNAVNDDSIINLRNFGRKSYDEVIHKLHELKIPYDEEIEQWVI